VIAVSSAEKYFTLNEIALMSLMGGLVFVMKTAFRMPLGIPGHTGIFLVIPVIIGVAIIRKPGSGTYIGLVSGVLLSFFGLSGCTSSTCSSIRHSGPRSMLPGTSSGTGWRVSLSAFLQE
jgi:uncharacterized membrane protein